MMRAKSALFAAAALLALTACSESKVETEKPEDGTKLSISIDDNDTATASTDFDVEMDVSGDAGDGKMEIKLPGGIEARVNMPEGVSNNTKFDIAGVGLYPGARVSSFKVDAGRRKADGPGHSDAVVVIGIAAPADAAAVADWYQQQFEAKKVAVSRDGETLAGKTEDGDDFTLALTPAATGSAGKLTIRDAG